MEKGNRIFDGVEALGGGRLDSGTLGGRVVLVVNVASRCGLTPQYEGLERLHARFADRGFSVVGVPCNQFAGQEPGDAEEILAFCSATYGTSFPMTEKLEVNGSRQHHLFARLTQAVDADGRAGEVEWNFEKFLLCPWGTVLGRFRPQQEPESPAIIEAIEAALDSAGRSRTVPASEVRVGDRVIGPKSRMLVTRIDRVLMGREDYLCFVEDTSAGWQKVPFGPDSEVEIVAAD